MGYGWQEAPICNQCGQLSLLDPDCSCSRVEPEGGGRAVFTWNSECPFHRHDPYDIPY